MLINLGGRGVLHQGDNIVPGTIPVTESTLPVSALRAKAREMGLAWQGRPHLSPGEGADH